MRLPTFLFLSFFMLSVPAHAQDGPTFEQLAAFLPEPPEGWEIEVVDQTAMMGGATAEAVYSSDDDFFTIGISDAEIFRTVAQHMNATLAVGSVMMEENEGGIFTLVNGIYVGSMPGETSRGLLLDTLATIDFAGLAKVAD